MDELLQDAAANPLVATSMVAQAEQALDEARASGADPALVAQYARALSAVRDKAWNMRRLQDVQMLGSLPAAASGEPARLALSGDTLYVAAGNLYELQPEEKRLVLLLARGNGDRWRHALGNCAVSLLTVELSLPAMALPRMFAIARAHGRDEHLAIDDVGGISDTLPIVSWGDAAYGVSWEGDIVRFFEILQDPSQRSGQPARRTRTCSR